MPRPAVLLAIAAVTSLPLTAQQIERHTLTGSDIAVYNLAGQVTIERGTGPGVVVEIARGGADAARLRVEKGPLRGRETLRVVYPADHITYIGRSGFGSSSTLRVREDGTFGDGDGERRGWRDGREVRIATRGGGLEAHADLKILIPAGQTAAVYLGVGEAAVTGTEATLRVDVASADVTIARTKGDLIVDTGSGAIEVTDAEGALLLDTGSGAVHVTRVRGGQLNIDTGSGEVSVSGAEVGRLLIDTGSGGVDATAVRSPDILIDTGSGAVRLEVLADVESLNIDTGSGGVTLTLPEGVGGTVDLETGSGDIDLGFPVQTTRISRSHLQGTIGDGQGRIVVETGSGSIRLKRS